MSGAPTQPQRGETLPKPGSELQKQARDSDVPNLLLFPLAPRPCGRGAGREWAAQSMRPVRVPSHSPSGRYAPGSRRSKNLPGARAIQCPVPFTHPRPIPMGREGGVRGISLVFLGETTCPVPCPAPNCSPNGARHLKPGSERSAGPGFRRPQSFSSPSPFTGEGPGVRGSARSMRPVRVPSRRFRPWTLDSAERLPSRLADQSGPGPLFAKVSGPDFDRPQSASPQAAPILPLVFPPSWDSFWSPARILLPPPRCRSKCRCPDPT